MNSVPHVLYFIKQSSSFIKFYNNCFHLTGSVLFFSYSYMLIFSTRIEPYQTVKILLPQDIIMSYSDLLTDSINFFFVKALLYSSLFLVGACAAGVSINGASSGFVASPNFPNNFDPLYMYLYSTLNTIKACCLKKYPDVCILVFNSL